MKNIYLFLFVFLSFSCKKDGADPVGPTGALTEISIDGKRSEHFEYLNGRLVRESIYFNCEAPLMVFNYQYDAGLLIEIKTGSRGTTSSNSSAMCNPSAEFEENADQLKYDSSKRVVRRTGKNSYFEYELNGSGQITKMTQYFGTQSRETFLKYDARGNVREISGAANINGESVRYEYDDQKNPFHQMIRATNFYASPFSSPNNVIKAFDKSGKLLWERKFKYNSRGLPTECLETNGLVYQYHYE